MSDLIVKTCANCGYRKKSKCELSGYYCSTERQYPSQCGRHYEHWSPRMTRFNRLVRWFIGYDNKKQIDI